MIERVPKSYYVEGDRLVHRESGHFSLLRDRSFREINYIFRRLPSQILADQLKRRTNPAIVADVGGGSESKAADGIKKRFKRDVVVFNFDPVAQASKARDGCYPVQSTITWLPLQTGTADFVYSHKMLPNLYDRDFTKKQKDAIGEMVRILKPGGVCITDIDGSDSFFEGDPEAQHLAEAIGAKISLKDNGMNHKPFRRLRRILDPERFSPHQFLVIQKYPINSDSDKIIESVPRSYSRWRTI